MDSQSVNPGRTASVTWAPSSRRPRPLKTTTRSPSAMPRAAASSGWIQRRGGWWRFAAVAVAVRITSYNVCYTKLLRHRAEADKAVLIARQVSGVQRVVKVFEYLD